MKVSCLLRFLFAALISIGLTIAPLGMPAVASDAPSGDDMMQMADMSGDMPCCPDKQKQGDCQDCPLMAICVAKALQNVPSSDGLPVREASSEVFHPLDEPVLAGLARPPPDQPPR